MGGLRAKIDYILKHNTFVNKLFKVLASAFFRFLGLFVPIDKNAILFSSLSRKYNDSPKAIYEYLLAHTEYSGYKFFWAIEKGDNTEIPGEFKRVTPDTLKYFITALRCKYWVTSVNIERGLKFKKKKTVYLNTWHGIPIKTVGNCAGGRTGYDFSHVDYFCISGEYEVDLYHRAFNVGEKQLLRVGMPRNDALYGTGEEKVRLIKERLKLPLDKKIILYAPTWRDSKDGGKTYSVCPPIDFEKWEREIGNDYLLLFRAHPYTSALMNVKFNSFVMDFSKYPVMNDLLKIADILISDYSATFFDYSILERPMICFAYDYEEYSNERGLFMDISSEIPGGVVFDEIKLLEKIKNYDFDIYEVRSFKNRYLEYGANATESCVKALFG